ncbi:MAG TPA: hypothetical protein VKA68_04015 [bacterium]|nr:hypothetical protein [bacterium]
MAIYRMFPCSREQAGENPAGDCRGLPLSVGVNEPLLIYPGQRSERRVEVIDGKIYYSDEYFVTGTETRADRPGHLWEYFLYP